MSDTIVALSSATGAGGVRAIVRVSGAGAWRAAGVLARVEGGMRVGWHEAEVGVEGVAVRGNVLLFAGPRSFTGEDVAELHVPQSPALVGMVMEALLRSGTGGAGGERVRMAEAGEFSARAFFNGKMDLTEAEGVAATIAAEDERQLRAAASLRGGNLHKEVERLAEGLADLLALIEAGIDFSDEEDVTFVDALRVESLLEQWGEYVGDLASSSYRVDRMGTLPTVVIVGKPNVGKSSLINALTGTERSIVSPLAGTTRDALSAVLETPQGRVMLVDVAGEEAAVDEMRGQMMEARRVALLEADLVVRVIDHEDSPWRSFEEEICCDWITAQNKSDLIPLDEREEGRWYPGTGRPWGCVSAKTGENLEKLKETIGRYAIHHVPQGERAFALNQRHRMIFHELQGVLWRGASLVREEEDFRRHPELVAAEVRYGLDLLGRMTGAISADEVLGRVFARFCIGK